MIKESQPEEIGKEEIITLEKAVQESINTARDIDIIDNVMIQTVTTQMSFSSMMIGLEKGDYVIPEFQRMYRWTENQVEELAISLVRGMPIPPIYCYRNKEQQIVILDGQQRVLSLYFYYIGKYLKRKRNVFIDARKITDRENKFKTSLESIGLEDKKFCMKYKVDNGQEKEVDITYENLSERLKRRIDFSPIMLIQINVDSEKYRDRTLHKIFANLNIGGTPLSSQELRNGIYSCGFYDMLYEINDTSKKWRKLYSGSLNAEVNKESKDVELLLKMCALKYYVKRQGAEFTLTGYKGKITILLDDFSEIAREFQAQEIQKYKEALEAFIEAMEDITGKSKELALQSMFVVWDGMKQKPVLSKRKYEKIIADNDYRSTIKSGTSARGEIEKRLRSVYGQLSKND